MRKEAARRGLDPDTWFNNVEIVVSGKIGLEMTTYVRNVFKYYVAYKLTLEAKREVREAREKLDREKVGGWGLRPPSESYFLPGSWTTFQVLSGLNFVIFCAAASVPGPRSFSYTTPSWFTMNVITPEFP